MLQSNCPGDDDLRKHLRTAIDSGNGGFGLNMWATFVDRDGNVESCVFSGETRHD